MSWTILWNVFLYLKKGLGLLAFMLKMLNKWVFKNNEKNFDSRIIDYTILIDDLNERYIVSVSIKIKNLAYLNFLLNSVSCEVVEGSKQILPEFHKIIFENIKHGDEFIFNLNYSLDPYEVLRFKDCGNEKRKELTFSFNFFLQIGTQIFKIQRSIRDNFIIQITNKRNPLTNRKR